MKRLSGPLTSLAVTLALLLGACAGAHAAAPGFDDATKAIAKLLTSVGEPSVRIQIEHIQSASQLQSALVKHGILTKETQGSSCDSNYELTAKGRSLARRAHWKSITLDNRTFAYDVLVGSFEKLRVLQIRQKGDSYVASFSYVFALNQNGRSLVVVASPAPVTLAQVFPEPKISLSRAGRALSADVELYSSPGRWIAGYPKSRGFPRVIQSGCLKGTSYR